MSLHNRQLHVSPRGGDLLVNISVFRRVRHAPEGRQSATGVDPKCGFDVVLRVVLVKTSLKSFKTTPRRKEEGHSLGKTNMEAIV